MCNPRGNMCLEPADAVVNAANLFLKHNGGVAAAIRKAAKPDVRLTIPPNTAKQEEAKCLCP